MESFECINDILNVEEHVEIVYNVTMSSDDDDDKAGTPRIVSVESGGDITDPDDTITTIDDCDTTNAGGISF